MARRFPAERHTRCSPVTEPTTDLAIGPIPAAAEQGPRANALHQVLVETGYQIVFRADAWTECFVERDAERWLGRGDGEHEALEDVLAQMVPSLLARALLAEHLAGMVAPVDGVAAEGDDEASCEACALAAEPEQAAPPEAAPPSRQVVDLAAAGEVKAEATAAVQTAPPSEEHIALPARSPDVAPPLVTAPARTATTEALDRELRRLSAADAQEMLTGLHQAIELTLPRFARLAAERQRLMLLVWICRARSIEERAAASHEVTPLVARVARQVSACAKVYWCGYSPALRLTAQPADTVDLRAGGGMPPRTWSEAVQVAQRRLDDHVARAADAGLDDDGWADRTALVPAPASPDTELDRAVGVLEAHLGPAEAADGELHVPADVDPQVLLRTARTLRWVRGRVQDHLKWGNAVGRFRRVLVALGSRGAAAREALEPSFTPAAPWATLIAGRSAAEQRGATVATLLGASQSPESLLAWLIPAFDVFTTPELAELLAPHRMHVSALTEADMSTADRRIRRRLRDLVRQLAPCVVGGPGPTEHDPPSAPEVDTTDDAPSSDREFEALCERIRPRVQGRRVLFVTNRQDPQLESRLADLLTVQITWCEGTVRRIQAQVARITQRSYDLVLCATGFLDHGVDGLLAPAAKAAKIPYVRVDRGRPLACVQALARTFGLGTAPNGDSSGAAEIR